MNVMDFPTYRKNTQGSERDDLIEIIDELIQIIIELQFNSSTQSDEKGSKDIREFALSLAVKILNDSELNKSAPFLVDKMVMLLIKESRHS
ncbi:MAG: hypothetical protein LKK36_06360 [Ewingella americana]|uniref:hypothetical protein n=1 Tax=Ewingella americana TaxID=41202 RepID=UPI002431F543|nr:hypothetical protein [Ewingella americana]MCI1676656.1 hypothetical protein [Ewingella americana]MCI1853754.1 hypothetical protein [Ewingella americana]MCI1860005.1 hypothetical protein [Ewingella americana]MCI2142333.1 hypothetical protein [Ewingella americana]MCI2163296.1 hypothetical protein [Ewingella americana]